MSFKEDLEIDKFNLDVEWERQPILYMEWAEKYAEKQFERDKMKTKLDIVKAELDAKIRQDPQKYGFDKKLTESAISSWIVQQKEYQEVYNELIRLNKEVSILSAAKEAFNHKKKALECLTQLWLCGYYSEPRIPSEARILSEKITKEILRSKLKEKIGGGEDE